MTDDAQPVEERIRAVLERGGGDIGDDALSDLVAEASGEALLLEAELRRRMRRLGELRGLLADLRAATYRAVP